MSESVSRGQPDCPYIESRLHFEFREDGKLVRSVSVVLQEDGERRSWLSRETVWQPDMTWEDRLHADDKTARRWFADRVCRLLGLPVPGDHGGLVL